MPPVVNPTLPALNVYIRVRGLMAAGTPSEAAMGSARCEKRPRSTSSRGGGRVDADALRDYDDCHLGEKCIFDHSCTRKHRPNSDRGGGGEREGTNSSANGGGGGTPRVGRGLDERRTAAPSRQRRQCCWEQRGERALQQVATKHTHLFFRTRGSFRLHESSRKPVARSPRGRGPGGGLV